MNNRIRLLPIFIVYVLCNFLMLLNKGVFWDDWTVFNMSYEGLSSFTKAGFVFPQYLYHALNQLPNSVFWYHALSFALGWAVVQLSVSVLHKGKLVDIVSINYIGLLLASSPLYHTRTLLISLEYVICLVAFLAACHLLIRYFHTGSIARRIAACSLFFFSFIISSLIPFYVVVLLVLLLSSHVQRPKDMIRYPDLLILPVAFWMFKTTFLKPEGLYALENYNQIKLSGLLGSPVGLLSAFYQSLGELYNRLALLLLDHSIIIALLIAFVMLKTILKKDEPNSVPATTVVKRFQFSTTHYVLFAGLILYILGSFAYVVVGKIPSFNNFSARNQLLLPFGYSFLTLGLIYLLITPKYRKHVLALVVSGCVLLNINMFLNYQKDSFRQAAIIANLKKADLGQDCHTFLINDSTMKYVETETSQCVYTGMLKYVTGEQTRLAFSEAKARDHIQAYGSLESVKIDGEILNCRDWAGGTFDCRMIITNGPLDVSSRKNTFKLMYKQHLQPAAFNEEIANAARINILPL